MSHYHHLSISERESIWESFIKGKSLREIASALGRNVSTISRELKRNKYKKIYRPSEAEKKYRNRRRRCKRKRILVQGELKEKVVSLISDEQWSPEQIASRIELENGRKLVSYTTIYRALKAGYMEPKENRKKSRQGRFPMEKNLRCKGWKGKGKTRRAATFVSKEIDERPKPANNRSQLGHWEGDLVYSSFHKVYIVTLVDRRSRYLLTGISKSKKPDEVASVMFSMLQDLPSNKLRSITLDRGAEFAHHSSITEQISNAVFYFAHPYSPWERGTNENTNGLLRQYVPKRTYKVPFSHELLKEFTTKLNNRPRKCLEWKTPSEVFFRKVLHLT